MLGRQSADMLTDPLNKSLPTQHRTPPTPSIKLSNPVVVAGSHKLVKRSWITAESFQDRSGPEPFRNFLATDVETMTTPTIRFWLPHESSLHGVQMNVPHHRGQVLVRINQKRFISAPKKRAVTPVSTVESLRVQAIHMAHDAGEIPIRCPQQQMVVIVHQTVREHLHTPQLMRLTERAEKYLIVRFAQEGLSAGAAAVHHMIHRPRKFDPQWP
jgi:hypothetical protein